MEQPGRRIAVTGANGFVGRHVVRHAVAAGFRVVGVVRSAAAASTVVQDGADPVVASGAEPPAAAFAGCAALVHLAQIGAERAAARYEEVNVELTRRVLEAAGEGGVPRAVFFSGLGVARYGMAPRCSNRYFLSKLAAEATLFRSGLEPVVFRPSYVVGPGDAFVPKVLAALAGGEVEVPGDGSYRMQPIAVADAAELVLQAASRPAGAFPTVFDLVGPEPVSYVQLLRRLAAVARGLGRRAELRVRQIPVPEAERQARAGGWSGLLPDELDCLLCDEVSDGAPLEALLGRPLLPLDDALAAAVREA